MATTITARVPSGVSAANTKRVDGVTASSYNAWGDSWGNAWADTWRVFLGLSDLGLTARVAEAPAANNTKRIA